MQRVGTKEGWLVSLGDKMSLDFAVWVLEIDGLHVPPFDRHGDGNGLLRSAGLDAEGWWAWLHAVLQARPGLEEMRPASLWRGDLAVGDLLTRLWDEYGPISNDRRVFRRPLVDQTFHREAGNLWSILRPYHRSIPSPLVIELVDYPTSVECLIPPSTIIFGIPHHLPEPTVFRNAIIAAADKLAHRR